MFQKEKGDMIDHSPIVLFHIDIIYRDEWMIFDVNKKYTQISIDYSDAPSFNANVSQYYESNAHAYGSTYTSVDRNIFLNEIKNSTYFCAMLHGSAESNKLLLFPGEELSLWEIAALNNSDLSSVKIVILTSCYSGRSGGFVDTLLSKGVDVVIGFSGDIEQETSAFWTKCLIYALTQGNTVQASIEYADAMLDDKYGDDDRAIFIPLIKDGIYTGTSDLSMAPCS